MCLPLVHHPENPPHNVKELISVFKILAVESFNQAGFPWKLDILEEKVYEKIEKLKQHCKKNEEEIVKLRGQLKL